jgi:HPr kinase/phosphorylase
MLKKSVAVSELLTKEAAHLQLAPVAGEDGLGRQVKIPRIQKPGLALVGYTDFVAATRVQILGATELTYLHSLEDDDAVRAAVDPLIALEPACIIATKGMDIPPAIIEACEEAGTPLLRTPQASSVFIHRLQGLLEERLAPQTVMHGVLVDVFGVGILLLGKSGIGKSETALDLVERGHPLIADDLVHILRKGEETVYGRFNELLEHCIEIRGLGILNVREMFGIAAVRERKRIDLVCEMVAWSEDEEYDRLGLDERRFPILDVELPLLTVPVRPGRNIAAIIEVAARNQLLKVSGSNAALELSARLGQELARGRTGSRSDVE